MSGCALWDAAQGGDDESEVGPGADTEPADPISGEPEPEPVPPNRDVDILFVIDNSVTMEAEQDSLVRDFPQFVSVLETQLGGLPNLHIGVVSTDLGVASPSIASCPVGPGDEGILQNAPRILGCSAPTDRYISDVLASDGSTRIKNYSGELAQTFSCIAQLGTSGCGFEQPFEAMRRALDPANVNNQGFVREGALLAIIFVTDADDCSASDPLLFSIDQELGPLSSYRCFEFGVVCESDDLTPGPRTNCQSWTDSPYMAPPAEYANFLKSLKPRSDMIVTGRISGPPSPVSVGTNGIGLPEVEPSCVSRFNSSCTVDTCAAPGVRLSGFLDLFPDRNASGSICNEDLTEPLLSIADVLVLAAAGN